MKPIFGLCQLPKATQERGCIDSGYGWVGSGCRWQGPDRAAHCRVSFLLALQSLPACQTRPPSCPGGGGNGSPILHCMHTARKKNTTRENSKSRESGAIFRLHDERPTLSLRQMKRQQSPIVSREQLICLGSERVGFRSVNF